MQIEEDCNEKVFRWFFARIFAVSDVNNNNNFIVYEIWLETNQEIYL